jgi:hypothetical protein
LLVTSRTSRFDEGRRQAALECKQPRCRPPASIDPQFSALLAPRIHVTSHSAKRIFWFVSARFVVPCPRLTARLDGGTGRELPPQISWLLLLLLLPPPPPPPPPSVPSALKKLPLLRRERTGGSSSGASTASTGSARPVWAGSCFGWRTTVRRRPIRRNQQGGGPRCTSPRRAAWRKAPPGAQRTGRLPASPRRVRARRAGTASPCLPCDGVTDNGNNNEEEEEEADAADHPYKDEIVADWKQTPLVGKTYARRQGVGFQSYHFDPARS